jgi:hypothetical protein
VLDNILMLCTNGHDKKPIGIGVWVFKSLVNVKAIASVTRPSWAKSKNFNHQFYEIFIFMIQLKKMNSK